jgi:TRAP-type C4-dicarboxylate transport system permease small subunit
MIEKFILKVNNILEPLVFGSGGEIAPIAPDLPELFGNITSLIRPIILITFVGMMIWAGYLRMTAAGNAEQEEKSIQTLIAAIIGFIIVVLAPVIVNIVQQVLNINPNI